jgi:drug/metabolite transporter (DMT)-like permease
MLRERLTALHVAVLSFGLAGALLLSVGHLRHASLLRTQCLAGDLLLLGSVAGSAFYNTYCKGLFAKFEQIEVLVFTYITGSLASIPLLIWVAPLPAGILRTFTLQSWLALGYQALVAYGLAMLVFFAALKRLPMTTVSVLLYLIPLFAVTLAVSVLGERLSPLAVCGGVIILISNLVFMSFSRGGLSLSPGKQASRAQRRATQTGDPTRPTLSC